MSTHLWEECPQPIVPEIGKLNITGIIPGSYAHFTCPKGFFTRGQSSRVCLINGEWEGEGAYCEIVQCGRPNLIHGEVEGGRFSFDNRVRYRCYTGYKLIGPPTSYCSHTGKWLPEGAAPRCEKIVCILPSLSENTRVLNAKPEYLPGDVVQFACNSGYFFLTSHDYLNCQADGTWHETAPTCDHTTCGTPPPIDNGSPLAAIAQYTVGTNVEYECDYGYTFASSRESIACLPRGVWEQPYPRCGLITCAAPPLVDNADIISGDPTETTFLSTIEFRCRQGYESERSMIIECLEDAKWTTPIPRCTAVDCGRPDGISFGTLEVRAYSYNNVAVYRCDRGYSIQGVSTRICQADRTWSGSVPRCSPISCGQPGDLDNGYFSGSDFTYLQTVHYSCNDGYRFSSASTMFKTCAESGIWEGVENTCDPITCPVPDDIKYGGWRGDRVFIYQSKITYYCNSGYTLQGEAGLTCYDSGVWSSPFPTCTPVRCFDPPSIKNGVARILGRTYGSKVEYRCNPGFTHDGADVIVCQADGKWSNDAPRCTAQQCPALTNITNGIVRYNAMAVGSLAAYTCNYGYERIGPEIRQCLSSLTWSEVEPTCGIIRCETLEDITNGRVIVESYTFQSTAVYECIGGYRLQGSSRRLCQADKTWSSLAPICDRVECDPLPTSIKNGLTIGRSYYYGDKVTFSCNDGYQLVGTSITNCQANGIWSSGVPYCEIVTCSPLTLPNGQLSSTRRTYASRISLSCNDNFRLIGPEQTFCQADGTWSSTAMRCIEIRCPVLDVPQFGRIEMSGRLVANFYCVDGYTLQGNQQLTCLENNEWSSVSPTCAPIQCKDLGDLVNGQIVLTDEHNYLSTANYVCDIGYRLLGESRVCQANGFWSATAASCEIKDCPQPSQIENGRIEGVDWTFGSVINYYCNVGYELSGTSLLICLETETWSETPPLCKRISCGEPELVLNSYRVGDSYEYNDLVEYRCDRGYELFGDNTRKCLANKSWSGQKPSCVVISCPQPGKIENGEISGTSYTYGSTIRYTCHTGYSVSGDTERQCLDTKQWSNRAPLCSIISCSEPVSISNGVINGATYTYQSQIEYVCDVGYTLHGDQIRNCLHTARWSGTTPSCQIIVCPVPKSIDNGVFSGSDFSFGSLIVYHCNEGYQMAGSNERLCMDSGQWSGDSPSCHIISCGQPESILNGRIQGDAYTYRQTVEYNCDIGYQLTGESSRLCKGDGSWSGLTPSCTIISCGDPGPIENGFIAGNAHTYQSVVTYSCDEGYSIQGETIRRCNEDGLWSGNKPSCIIKYCPVPQSIDNGAYTGTDYGFNSVITYSCDEGYTMTGSAVRTCLSSQQWSGSLPSCTLIVCRQPEPIPNGMVVGTRFNYNDLIEYSCDVGYDMDGTNSRRCLESGLWSGQRPNCIITNCPVPKPIDNGEITGNEYTFGSTVIYSCLTGYEIVGDSFRLCLQTKMWSGTEPYCAIIDCGNPGDIDNGVVKGSVFTYGSTVTYECDEGYSQEGRENRLCQDTGEWSGSLPSCTLIVCGQPEPIPNGMVVGTRFNYNDLIEYSCDVGYDMDGTNSRRCLESGLWSGQRPNCIITNCPVPKPIDNGEVTGKEYTFGSTVIYSCLTGYEIMGDSFRLCLQTKMWSGTEPYCAIIDCGNPGDIDNGVVKGSVFTYGSTVVYTCDEGYSREGRETRLCQDTGEWSDSAPRCLIVNCAVPRAPDNGGISDSDYLFGSTINYNCVDGYELVGDTTRICLSSKQWSGNDPNCIKVTCDQLDAPNNGRIVGTDLTFESVVRVQCDTGYRLEGSEERICQADRAWSGVASTCVEVRCPEIKSLLNGRVHGTSVTYNSEVRYECNEGYEMIGQETRRCTASGAWSGNEPVCTIRVCPDPESFVNGTINIDAGFDFGSTIIYECDEGYNIIGHRTRTCLSSQAWDVEAPVCEIVTCPVPAAVLNGASIGRSRNYADIIGYKCNSGYVLQGTEERVCQSNGRWSSDAPLCNPVDCGVPDIGVDNVKARLITGTTTLNSPVVFYCTEGYNLIGFGYARCTESGHWSETHVSCERVYCPHPGVIEHGTIEGTSFFFGDRITVDCDAGYRLDGQRSITCLSSGRWDTVIPNCKPVECLYPEELQNGYFEGKSFTYGNTIEYFCNDKYRMDGNGVRTCDSNGAWTGQIPSCQLVICEAPSIVPNGIVAESYMTVYTYRDELNYHCSAGYTLIGPSVIRCELTGEWSGKPPHCDRSDCPRPRDIDHGTITGNDYKYKGSITYLCDEGYVLSGDKERSCLDTGEWSGADPICDVVTCPEPASVDNARVTGLTTFQSTITYECFEGFRLIGDSSFLCLASGEWNGEAPVCDKIKCAEPRPLFNGYIDGAVHEYSSEISYSCDTGFILNGNDRRVCQSSGEWSGDAPTCDRIQCAEPPQLDNGQLSGNVFEYEATVQYSCNEGYSLRGSRSRTCLYDGSWSGIRPHCRILSCRVITPIDNGYIIGDEFEYGSVVSFGCNDGYVLEGAASLTCQADGSWGSTEPSCGRRACKRPEEIPNGGVYNTSFLYGDEVTFYCNEGYELLGDHTSLCSADGTWLTRAPQCVMIQCGAPPDIDYGVRTGDSFNFEDMVYYSCVNGYELEGNNLLRCDSKGKWSGSLPSCIPIKCEMPPVIPRATTIVSRLTYGSEVTYKCNPGYKLIGKATAHCEDDGTWLFDEMASCVPIDCGVFPDISNGYITGDSTTFGSTVYLTCNQGYEMVGEELSSCAESGAWSSTTSVCQPISCGPPRATPHIIIQGDNFVFGGQVIMKCEEGYNLQGDRVVTCTADGTWSGDTPTCQAVVCKEPPVSSPVLMSGTDFSFGQSVSFKCSGGYTLKGSSSIVCLSSGLWSGSTPVCAPVVCGKPRLNEGVKLTGDSFSYSDSVGYSCGTGYNLVGARSARCQETGKWSASSPLCKAVECDPITVSEHIVVLQGNPSVRSSYGASIVFDCKSGYGLSGDDTLICAEDGTWQGTNPTCHRTGPLRDSCEATVDIQHSETILPGFIAGDVIDVQCVKGYSSRGNMTSVCQPDRSWTTPTGHCTRVFCGKPTIRDMVNVWGMSGRSFYYGDHVRFRCRPGLRPSRDPPIITCTETGNWNSDIYCTGRCKFGCLNGGMCVGLNRCKCPYGYAGRRCEQAICIFPCMNGGKCVAPYQCQCEPGYRGHRCEIKTG